MMPSNSLTRDQEYDLLKFCVELADRATVRRGTANTFFVSLHSIVASVVGYVAAVKSPTATTDDFSLLALATVGGILSLAWWGILRYFRRLSMAKWEVINEMEGELGISPFVDEWDKLHPNEKSSGWLKKQTHREATVVEQVVPLAFLAIYVALAVRIVCA